MTGGCMQGESRNTHNRHLNGSPDGFDPLAGCKDGVTLGVWGKAHAEKLWHTRATVQGRRYPRHDWGRS